MPVLGICGINGTFHDSGACLVLDDGQWIAAEEERFNRIKHSSGFPALAIEWCLREAGIRSEQLDAVGFSFNMQDRFARYFAKTVLDHPTECGDFFAHSYKAYRYWARDLPRDMAAWLGVPQQRLHAVRHHAAHAASAFYPSGFDSAAILVVDGVGEAETASYFSGRGRDTVRIGSPMFYPASIGMLYNYVAVHLGLGLSGGAGKLMGLAPYGRPLYADAFREIVRLPAQLDQTSVISFDRQYISYHLGGAHSPFTPLFYERFGEARKKSEPITQHHADIAASIQRVLEDCVVFMAKQLRLISGERQLCYAGGCALNIDANTRIRAESGFDDVFIMPSAYDAGTAIGAAFAVHLRRADARCLAPLGGAFKGPAFAAEEVKGALDAAAIAYRKVDDPAAAAAEHLAHGAIVGWFQGREEIGPRALGNRSILMNPGVRNGKDIINSRVKFREAFRPFAPSVPVEDANKFFEAPWPSPHMLYAYKVRPKWRNALSAIVHVDGSARVHTVSADENPLFHKLLKAFGGLSGHPVLLNTSLNVQGQPLVSSVQQAIDLFRHSNLDTMVIGDFVLSRFDRNARTKEMVVAPLAAGIVDAGTAPAFAAFEQAPVPAPTPDGMEATDREVAIFRQHLETLIQPADDSVMAGLANLIDAVESDLSLQAAIGTEGLATLWRALADAGLHQRDLDTLVPAASRDLFLMGQRPFPGMSEPSGAARGLAETTRPPGTEASRDVPCDAEQLPIASQFKYLANELARQEGEIARLQRELADRGAAVEATLGEVTRRDKLLHVTQAEVNRRDALLADKSAEVEAAQQALMERTDALKIALTEIGQRDALLMEKDALLAKKEADIAAARQEAIDRDEAIKIARTEIERKDASLAESSALVAATNAELAATQKEMGRRDETARSAIAAKDSALTEMRQELAMLQAEISAGNASLKEAMAEIDSRDAMLEALNDLVPRLTADVADARDHWRSADTANEDLKARLDYFERRTLLGLLIRIRRRLRSRGFFLKPSND